MIRRTFWQGLLGCAMIALIAGCGSDNATTFTVLPATKTQTISKAAGGTITTAKSVLTIPMNALAQDGAITVTDDPTDIPTAAKGGGLVASTKVTAASGVTLTPGSSLTLALPFSRANTYPVYVYKVDGGAFTEVFATPTTVGNTTKAGFPVTSFGTYAVYNANSGAVPGTQQPAVQSIKPLENSALYGMVQLRVSNILNPANGVPLTVAITVGGVAVTPAPTIAYNDANATRGDGGAINFRVPYGLPSGAQPLIVTLNGVASAPYSVTISNTNPFAVFTLSSGAKFVAELRKDKAPNTVANFVGLATGTKTWTPTVGATPAGSPMNTPLYNGVTFHRVQANASLNFAQTGDPITAFTSPPSGFQPGTGGPGFTIPFEDSGLSNIAGSIAMARENALNTAGSQIFINTKSNASAFDVARDGSGTPTGGYSVFGQVVEGLSSVVAIPATEDISGTPLAGPAVTKISTVVITGKIDTK